MTDTPTTIIEVHAVPMQDDMALVVAPDAITLILRDGMLPRATVYQLGVLLSGLRVMSVGPSVDSYSAPQSRDGAPI